MSYLIFNDNCDVRQMRNDEKWITVNGTHVKVEGNGTSKPGEYDELTGAFKNKKNSDEENMDGGKGSGNFGHGGRPGQVGGSSPSGGLSTPKQTIKSKAPHAVKQQMSARSKAISDYYLAKYSDGHNPADDFDSVQEKEGDLMNIGADCVGHQTNCAGIMGGGVALQVRNEELSSREFKKYEDLCDKEGNRLMGTMQVLDRKNGKKICNLFGEDLPGAQDIDTDYEALSSALDRMVKYCKDNGYSAALPKKLGCGLAGGDWNVVKPMVCEKFGKAGVNLTIVSRPKKPTAAPSTNWHSQWESATPAKPSKKPSWQKQVYGSGS